MRRLVFLVSLVLLGSAAPAQVWEKLVQPGLSYRMEVDLRVPRIVHALRWSQGAPGIAARSELAGPKIYDASADRGRGSLTEMAQRSQAVAALNGDFFPFTGDPLGAMVRDRELLSRPWPKRPSFAWGPASSAIANLAWKGSVESANGIKLELDGWNEEVPNEGLVLFTDASGLALAKPPSLFVVLKLDEGRWTPTNVRKAEVVSMTPDVEALAIPEGGAVLAARGKDVAELAKFIPGTSVSILYETSGLDWSKFTNVLAGGPTLVRGSKVAVDWQEGGFRDTFALRRHPRSAIGRTASGDVWLVVVDGRQPMSDGATLDELAGIMLRLGCSDAINLDGGGSSSVNLTGIILNRPSDGVERKISNGIVLVSPSIKPVQAEDPPAPLVVQGPKRLIVGENRTFVVLTSEGRPITNLEVIWSAQGSVWVDQDGVVRPFKAGPGTIIIASRGQRIAIDVVVEEAPKPVKP